MKINSSTRVAGIAALLVLSSAGFSASTAFAGGRIGGQWNQDQQEQRQSGQSRGDQRSEQPQRREYRQQNRAQQQAVQQRQEAERRQNADRERAQQQQRDAQRQRDQRERFQRQQSQNQQVQRERQQAQNQQAQRERQRAQREQYQQRQQQYQQQRNWQQQTQRQQDQWNGGYNDANRTRHMTQSQPQWRDDRRDQYRNVERHDDRRYYTARPAVRTAQWNHWRQQHYINAPRYHWRHDRYSRPWFDYNRYTYISIYRPTYVLPAYGYGYDYGAYGSSYYGPVGCGRDVVGAVLGGVAGGLIGAHNGDGRATLGGAIIGAILGGALGHAIDLSDQACYGQVLEYVPSNQPVYWESDGAQYQVTPLRTYQTGSGEYCREYQTYIYIDGREEQAYGTACRQPDGAWRAAS